MRNLVLAFCDRDDLSGEGLRLYPNEIGMAELKHLAAVVRALPDGHGATRVTGQYPTGALSSAWSFAELLKLPEPDYTQLGFVGVKGLIERIAHWTQDRGEVQTVAVFSMAHCSGEDSFLTEFRDCWNRTAPLFGHPPIKQTEEGAYALILDLNSPGSQVWVKRVHALVAT